MISACVGCDRPLAPSMFQNPKCEACVMEERQEQLRTRRLLLRAAQ